MVHHYKKVYALHNVMKILIVSVARGGRNRRPLPPKIGSTMFLIQFCGIHSQKSDLNHYFGVDSTILRVDFHFQNEVIPNMTPKRVDFHSTVLIE